MAEEGVNAVGANVPARDLNGPQIASDVNFMQKYGEERDKRLQGDGRQYIDPRTSAKFRHFLEDPWVERGTPVHRPVVDGGRTKVLVVGAGFGGILFAVKLIHAGFKAEDLLIVDPAGGFGGTWYWNRYPGLMCDTEAYIYLPLLEEMDYMPKHKYASGHEIRKYGESIAEKYSLYARAQFQSYVKSVTWDGGANDWIVKISEEPKGGQKSNFTVRAENVIFASGLLSNAKIPDMEGIDLFEGHQFHTSRWDYDFTGGNPETPALDGLRDKTVAYIGTGATAVQSIPHLAQAKDLFVFQRTASSVDRRDNRETDPKAWKSEIATGPGWQRERSRNFHAFVGNAEVKPEVNLVDDEWTKMPSYCALIGGPKKVTMENIAEHVGQLHALDYPRSERVRKRAEEIVKDLEIANALKAWYPGWCKRPTFHDEYLQAFNLPNVHLVDTAGKGIERVTRHGVVAGGKEYPVDVTIWGTGFVTPFIGSAAGKAGTQVYGRNGVALEERNTAGELCTLHGIVSRDFPNVFWPGPLQAGASPNQMFVLDQLSSHVAHVMSAARRTCPSGKVVIEPSEEAQEAWSMQIAMGAVTFAGMSGCTPGYLNMEGLVDKIPPEQRTSRAKQSIWPLGIESFAGVLEDWRGKGGLEGLEINSERRNSTVRTMS